MQIRLKKIQVELHKYRSLSPVHLKFIAECLMQDDSRLKLGLYSLSLACLWHAHGLGVSSELNWNECIKITQRSKQINLDLKVNYFSVKKNEKNKTVRYILTPHQCFFLVASLRQHFCQFSQNLENSK